MANMSKQDRQGARTPADLARRINLKQSFEKVEGYANEARRAAEQAEDAVENFASLFASDITMTGTLTNTVEGFIPPGEEETTAITNHMIGVTLIPEDQIPLYDFNSDGVLDSRDAREAREYALGLKDFKEWPGAVKTFITMTIDLTNPEKAIHFTGTNMWGREIDSYIGISFTSAVNTKTEGKIEALQARIAELETAVETLQNQNGG